MGILRKSVLPEPIHALTTTARLQQAERVAARKEHVNPGPRRQSVEDPKELQTTLVLVGVPVPKPLRI